MEDFKLIQYKGNTLDKPLLNKDAVGDGIIEQIVQEMQNRPSGVTGSWTVREKQGGEWVPVLRRKNILTNYGLTALIAAVGGNYTPPLYLVYDGYTTHQVGSSGIGDTSVRLTTNLNTSGSSSLVLSAGLAAQETVPYTSFFYSSGSYQYNLSSACLFAHVDNDPALRNGVITDTLANIQSEQQYDPAGAPNTRAIATAGYSSGVGNYIMQFYLLSSQANGTNGGAYFGIVGTSETATVGTGNLHNTFPLGYTHTNTNDVEIDVVLTITNS